MTQLNPYSLFVGLLPKTPLKIATVISSTDESTLVSMDGGLEFEVRGGGKTPGNKVFIRDGVIESDAPSLSAYTATI